MSVSATYVPAGEIGRDPLLYTPEMSRRARGVPTWVVLKALGRSGLAELVERTSRLARRFASGLEEAGFDILNEVVLNQILVSFGSPEKTLEVVAGFRPRGRCSPARRFGRGRRR